jgi:hypothetical protein
MSAIWESDNWIQQFGIRQTGNRQFGMLTIRYGEFEYVVITDNTICQNSFSII